MGVKLHVANLAAATTAIDLHSLFAQAGAVDNIELVTNRDTGQPSGFAFVTMRTQAEAEKAIQMMNALTVHNHALQVDLARPRASRPPTGRPGGAFGNGGSPRSHKRRGGSRRY